MAMLHQDCASGASGVLKLNSKMLQPSDLRKLDRLEKSLLVEMGRSGKGEIENSDFDMFLYADINLTFLSLYLWVRISMSILFSIPT